MLAGPRNISNNDTWADYGTEDYRWIAYPTIAATEDGRFVLAWLSQRPSGEGWWHSEIHYAVANKDGSMQRSATRITGDANGDTWSFYPSAAAAPGNRATIFYDYDYDFGQNDNGYGVHYATVNAQGELDKTNVLLAQRGVNDGIDAALLSDGHTMVVWSSWDDLSYAVLGPQQTVAVEGKYLVDPLNASSEEMENASVAPVREGKAVVTWSDAYDLSISYALLDSSGAVLTEPQMAYQGMEPFYPFVVGGQNGSGTTSYSWQPPAAPDVAVKFPLTAMGGLSGQKWRYRSRFLTMARPKPAALSWRWF